MYNMLQIWNYNRGYMVSRTTNAQWNYIFYTYLGSSLRIKELRRLLDVLYEENMFWSLPKIGKTNLSVDDLDAKHDVSMQTVNQ